MYRLLGVAVMTVLCGVYMVGCGCDEPIETVPTVPPPPAPSVPSSGITDPIDDPGLGAPDEAEATDEPAADVEATAEDPPAGDDDTASALGTDGRVRFVANKKLEVPGMMCPYGCYPAVEKALSQVAGVEGVQLAEQPEDAPEGGLVHKVVELKVSDAFDLDSALAALKEAEFEASELN